MPEKWPHLETEALKSLRGVPYSHVAASVLKHYVGSEIEADSLARLLHDTYHQDIFHHPATTPLIQISADLWILELFHGPTLAFKDYALQLLGKLFDHVLTKRNQRITIIGATSGDTGSAAIDACKNCANIDIFILHPKDRTSVVQRKQMTTVQAENVHNIALEGTFDDCQALVKAMFEDASFRKDLHLSAINSINWARIAAQIVYYVSAAVTIGAPARPVSFAVPTGNFGNVFAAHCARQMGLPIEQLIIGTNKNDILARFFETGEMKKESVETTLSPSMDIQVSSNFERYLFELLDGDDRAVQSKMESFKSQGSFTVPSDLLKKAQNDFKSVRCDENQTLEIMRSIYRTSGYILDPHTAVGVHAALQRKNNTPVIALACAHPAKFPQAVEEAIGHKPETPERLAKVFDRPEFMTPLPNDLDKVKKFVKQHSSLT